jgi:nucleotide-binding universal stress UspA family protein
MTQVNRIAESPGREIAQPALDRLLVGVDFRQPSLAAARWAATHFGCRTQLALAHVQTVPEVPGFLQPIMPVLDDRLVARFGRPLHGMRGFASTLGATDLSVHVRVGQAVQSLADVAGNLEADLVVLGRKSLDGSRGRTLERLIRYLNVPALIIGNDTGQRPRRILAAVDDAPIGRQVVGWAARLAQYFRAELTLLHVLSGELLAHACASEEGLGESPAQASLGNSSCWVSPTHAWLRSIGSVDGEPSVVRTSVAVGAAGPTILARALAARSDLIVVGRNGAHASGPGGIGSATRLALRGAQVPLLVVPDTGSFQQLQA